MLTVERGNDMFMHCLVRTYQLGIVEFRRTQLAIYLVPRVSNAREVLQSCVT